MTIFCKRHDALTPGAGGEDDVMIRIPDPPPPPKGAVSLEGVKDLYTVNLSYRPSSSGPHQPCYEEYASSAPTLNETGSTIGIGSASTAASSFGSGAAFGSGRELVERKTQQRTTQQVTKVTKVYTTRRYEGLAPSPLAAGTVDLPHHHHPSRDSHKMEGGGTTADRQLEPVDVSTTMLTGPPQTIEEKIITEMYDPSFGSPRHEEITYRYSPMPPPLPDLPYSSYPPGIGTLHLSSTSYADRNEGDYSSGFSSSHTHKLRPYQASPSPYSSHLVSLSNGGPIIIPPTINPDDEDYPISESGAGTLEPLRNGSADDDYYEPRHLRRMLQRAAGDRDEELAMLLRAEAGGSRLRAGDDMGRRYVYTDDSNRSSAILLKDGKNGYREAGTTDDEIPHHNSCDYQDSPRLFPNLPRSSLNNGHNHNFKPRQRYEVGNGEDFEEEEEGGIMVSEMPDREICNRYYPPSSSSSSRHNNSNPAAKASWRDPDVAEVIEYLTSPDTTIKANAAAYLQHLCYHDDRMKSLAGKLGAIPTLIEMLSSNIPEVQRNACGALRNMAYGRANEENKKLILDYHGIPALISIFKRTPDENLKEVISGLLWNMSSYEDIKRPLLETCLKTFNESVIVPQREVFEAEKGDLRPVAWSTIFRNVMGVIRNCSSDGVYARKLLRETPSFVHSLLAVAESALARSDCDNKSIENCLCTLRNLSYRLQETVDPEYESEEALRQGKLDQHPNKDYSPKTGIKVDNVPGPARSGTETPASSTSGASTSDYSTSSSNLKTSADDIGGGRSHQQHIGCFGTATPGNALNNRNGLTLQRGSGSNSKESSASNGAGSNCKNGHKKTVTNDKAKLSTEALLKSHPAYGPLWDPVVVVKLYLGILRESANPLTLEAAAGALQNLAACYWQPSIDIRTAVRKEKGLPILVELIKLDNDKVVCAVVTALRNLSIDVRNKELIGKYAMRELVSKLPNPPAPGSKGGPRASNVSDETICAVLAVLHQVIYENPEFAQSLMESRGIEKLVHISQQSQILHPSTNAPINKSSRYASQVLAAMWKHKELREVYARAGWNESVFENSSNIQKSVVEQNGIHKDNPLTNNVKSRVHANGGPKDVSTLMRPISSQGPSVTPDRTPLPNQRGPSTQAIYANNNNVRGNDSKAHYAHHNNMNGKPVGGGYTYEPIYTQVNKKPPQGTLQYGNGNHHHHKDVLMIPMEKMEIRADGKSSRYDQCASDSWV